MDFFSASPSSFYVLSAGVVLLSATAAVYLFRTSLKGIRGPPRSSFWLGLSLRHSWQLDLGSHSLSGNHGDFRYQAEVGDVEFPWLQEFGGAWKLHGPLGVRS